MSMASEHIDVFDLIERASDLVHLLIMATADMSSDPRDACALTAGAKAADDLLIQAKAQIEAENSATITPENAGPDRRVPRAV